MSQQAYGEVINTEHISGRDGENINAKRIGLYGYDYSASQWRRLAVNASGSLLAGAFAPSTEPFVTIGNTSELTAERALTGTANQVVITDNGADSTVVLSLPQNIHTAATPTFSGLTLSGLTASLPVVTDGSKNLASVSYATFAGNIDHGSLAGLSDDDHSQYFLLAGRNGNVANLIQNNIVTTSTQTLLLANNQAAASGLGQTEQYSPALDFLGHSWKSGIGASDRTVRARQELRTLTSAGTPSGILTWLFSVDTGTPSFTSQMTLTSAGLLTTATASFTTMSLTSTAASIITIGGDIVAGRRTADVLALAANDRFEATTAGFGKNSNASIGVEVLIPSGGQGFRIESGTSTNISFSTYVTNDDFIRFGFLASGKMEWGPGNVGGDLTFERTSAALGLLTGGLDVTVDVRARQLLADGDSGGTASTTTFTNATDTPTATLDWTAVGAPNGYFKAYNGTQAVVVPFWNT